MSARAALVDHAGDGFFADAVFAGNEHVRIASRGAPNLVSEGKSGRTPANQLCRFAHNISLSESVWRFHEAAACLVAQDRPSGNSSSIASIRQLEDRTVGISRRLRNASVTPRNTEIVDRGRAAIWE
jgi:hypothetical protein